MKTGRLPGDSALGLPLAGFGAGAASARWPQLLSRHQASLICLFLDASNFRQKIRRWTASHVFRSLLFKHSLLLLSSRLEFVFRAAWMDGI